MHVIFQMIDYRSNRRRRQRSQCDKMRDERGDVLLRRVVNVDVVANDEFAVELVSVELLDPLRVRRVTVPRRGEINGRGGQRLVSDALAQSVRRRRTHKRRVTGCCRHAVRRVWQMRIRVDDVRGARSGGWNCTMVKFP